MKKFIINLLFKLTRAPSYHKKSLVLSLLMFKLFQLFWREICYGLRRMTFVPTERKMTPEQKARLEKLKADVDEKGVSIINDYFAAQDFAQINADFDAALERTTANPFRAGGHIRTIALYGDEPRAEEQRLIGHFSHDPVLLSLVEYVHKRRLDVLPRIVLQEIRMPDDAGNIPEPNAVLHSDRHYHHAKAFFYLNELGPTTGAYVYAYGSQRVMNFWRLVHEVDLDVRESLADWRRRLGKPQTSLNEGGIEVIRPELLKRMGHPVVSMDGPGNSFVFSDNIGFHARGQMGPGALRRQVHIHFTYVEIPLFARLIRWAVLRLKPSMKPVVT